MLDEFSDRLSWARSGASAIRRYCWAITATHALTVHAATQTWTAHGWRSEAAATPRAANDTAKTPIPARASTTLGQRSHNHPPRTPPSSEPSPKTSRTRLNWPPIPAWPTIALKYDMQA